MTPVIAVLTDFGTQDAYVGVMKAVMLGIAPQASLVDLTHEIPPQAVAAGAYALWTAHRYFPDDSVFCAVVDPGVGSSRRGVAARITADGKSHRYVAPDNGLLTPLLDSGTVDTLVVLENPRYRLPDPSATFHGRDVFAPAAAHLAAGVPIEVLGPARSPRSLLRIDWPHPRRTPDGWCGAVIHVDRFGNLVTNLPGDRLAGSRWRLRLRGVEVVGPLRTFADVADGAALAYVGSSGLLEFALRNGNARAAWRANVGDPVTAAALGED